MKYTYPADSYGNQLRQLFKAPYHQGDDFIYGYRANADANWDPIYTPDTSGTLQLREIH